MSVHLSVHENVGVDVDGGDLDGDVVLQLALGRSQLLVGRLRPPQVVVKNLPRDNHSIDNLRDLGRFGEILVM